MKFLVLCALILSIAFFMGTAQAQAGPESPPAPHHYPVRGVRYADEPKVPPKGEAGCCG